MPAGWRESTVVSKDGTLVVGIMPLMLWVWPKLKAVAHTLPYDAAVMRGFQVPRQRFASTKIPVLALFGSKTDERLQKASKAVADAVPGARLQSLAGQTHNVSPAALTPAVVEFFGA
jgi:hypothetical protein